MNIRIGQGGNIRIYANGKAESNGPVEITGGQVSVSGNLTNSGKIKVFKGGRLEINNDFLNSGDISINDPEKVKEIIIEVLKTSKSVADFGTELLKKLHLLN
jgi:predicted acyltransferase (DUF342 family)